MKLLKYIGFVIVCLLLIFLSLGLFVRSFEYSAIVVANAPPVHCWSILHDTSRMKKWMPGFKKLTLKSGENLRIGAQYEFVIQQDQLYVMQETVKEVQVPNLIRFEMTNDVMLSEYEFTLIAKNNQTEITNHFRVMGKNMLWRSILFISKSYLQSGSQEQLELLKLEIENTPSASIEPR